MNNNLKEALVFVEQLASMGVDTACIASGSRSTPLTLAFTSHDAISCYGFIDERGAAFFALGRAKETGKPVVVISTSGTAGANFLPAICEAKEIGVPLLILTADRPHELRISGANQTMDQIKLFGDKVSWFVDVAPPGSVGGSQYIKQLALQAYQNAMYPEMAAVHLNFPFRKPLEPKDVSDMDAVTKAVRDAFSPIKLSLPRGHGMPDLTEVSHLYSTSRRILIILGPETDRYMESQDIRKLAEMKQAVVLTDALSGFRYIDIGVRTVTNYDLLLAVRKIDQPDLVIQFGEMPISKHLNSFLAEYRGEWIVVSSRRKLTDATLRSTHLVKTDPRTFVDLLACKDQSHDEQWVDRFFSVATNVLLKTEELLSDLREFEPLVIRELITVLKPSRLWISNSLAVRHFDEFIHQLESAPRVSSSRGVSGIDGIISTALGTATVGPTVLVTGDLTFIHDVNGLNTMSRYKLPLVIILVNNSGGAIFDRLPISEFDPPFEEFLTQSHYLKFQSTAEQFGISYFRLEPPFSAEGLEEELPREDGMIIELRTKRENVEPLRQRLISLLKGN